MFEHMTYSGLMDDQYSEVSQAQSDQYEMEAIYNIQKYRVEEENK